MKFLITDSIPSTPLASVLAQIIKDPSLHSLLALADIYIFFTMSDWGISDLPSKCPHLFGKTYLND